MGNTLKGYHFREQFKSATPTNDPKAMWQRYSNKGNNKYTNLFDNDELDKT